MPGERESGNGALVLEVLIARWQGGGAQVLGPVEHDENQENRSVTVAAPRRSKRSRVRGVQVARRREEYLGRRSEPGGDYFVGD